MKAKTKVSTKAPVKKTLKTLPFLNVGDPLYIRKENCRKAVIEHFFKEIVRFTPKDIKESQTLNDVALAHTKNDKAKAMWASQYVQMYLDRTVSISKVTIRHLANKPLNEIFDHLAKVSFGRSEYGWK